MDLSENEILITQQAFNEFLKQKIKGNLNIQFELDLISPYCTQIRKQRDELREKQAARLGTLWLWLTISPKKEIKLKEFLEKVEKFAERKMFEDYLYVIEQRGQSEEELGKGFHAHLLLKRSMKYKQNKIISNSKNTFKKMTNVDNHDIFNYHWCPEEYLKDKKEYILGTKTGCEKDKKQFFDVLFREKNNLNIYYKKTWPKAEKEETKKMESAEITTESLIFSNEFPKPTTS